MSFNIGDKVKIIDPSSRYNGELGTVAFLYSDEESLLIRLDRGIVRGYFISEVEMVEAVGEDIQIYKIAGILYNTNFGLDWDMEEAHKAAEELYKAGVRHYV